MLLTGRKEAEKENAGGQLLARKRFCCRIRFHHFSVQCAAQAWLGQGRIVDMKSADSADGI